MIIHALLLAVSLLQTSDEVAPSSESVIIESVAVKVCEEVAVPAMEAGVLARIDVKPGDFVDTGELLGQLRDNDIQLLVERTALDAEIAKRKSENELDLRYAKKSTEVARAELARSNDSNAKYAKTVSNSELDRQRLLVEQGELEVQKAEHEREIAGMMHQIRANEHRTALEQLERRKIFAPLKGMVVEVNRSRGEWVQPGDSVVRIIRLDRLRMEGFLKARYATLKLVGHEVKIESTRGDDRAIELPGKVVFVSPEVDPLNAQVRIWVDVDNTELLLQPGMTARIIIKTP